MAERLGQAFWPGVTGMISCSYTVSHGISPGIATLEIPEQDVSKILSFGSLVITDGVGAVRLNKCKVVDISWGSGGGGRTITLSIADRRWMWQFGAITGNYNHVDPYPDPELFPPGVFVVAGGPYAPGTYRQATDLMYDCFAQMREGRGAVAPAAPVPVVVSWNESNPAAALAEVADAVGYRVVYQPFADRVLVTPAGVGNQLPADFPIVTDHASVNLPQRPNTIQLVGGNTLFNDYLMVEPVGLEKNGQIRHIDKLSYRPVNGWGRTPPETFADVVAAGDLTQVEAIELAKRHVWRTFRVKMTDVVTQRAPGPNVAGYGLVRDRKQIVLGTRVFGQTKQADGQFDTQDPWCVGSTYILPDFAGGTLRLPAGLTTTHGNTDLGTGIRLPHKFSIDSARGLVIFNDQMFRRTGVPGAQVCEPPILFVHTSFQIRSIVGQVPVKFLWGGTLAGMPDLGCPAEYLRHPELGLILSGVRNSRDMSLAVVANNLDQLIPPANYYLAAANARYELGTAGDRTYAGIVPIEPDGAITQVTWSVGGGGPATTRASRNGEHAQYLPAYPERRRNELAGDFGNVGHKLARAAAAAPIGSQNPTPAGMFGPPAPGPGD